MDDERIQRAIERMQKSDVNEAEFLAKNALADTVLALLAHGRSVNVQALTAELLEAVQDLAPTSMERMQHEAAAHLLGWTPAPLPEPATTRRTS